MVPTILVALLLVPVPGLALEPPSGTDGGGLPSHPPIRITQDEGSEGFIVGHDPITGEPLYRPGSGVVAGNGTATDPYVIEGWSISPTHRAGDGSTASAGVLVRDTRAHLVLRHNHVDGLSLQVDGILLRNATNVTVQHTSLVGNEVAVNVHRSPGTVIANNTITGNGDGILVETSDQAGVTGNTVAVGGDALGVDRSDDVAAANNSLTGSGVGLRVERSHNLRATGNTVTGNDHGLLVGWSPALQLSRNTVDESRYDAIRLYASPWAEIANNTITHNQRDGLFLEGSEHARLANNSVTDNRVGVNLQGSPGTLVVSNELTGNRVHGVLVAGAGGTRLVANNLHTNLDDGLHIDGATVPVDARDNWWGSGSGPSGGETDACTGLTAIGTGEGIGATNGGSVCFEPWLGSPNPGAGPAP